MRVLQEIAQMGDERLLVSIIIVNHNYACYVEDAIESALHQTYQPLEVIVVDDGSTDNSVAVIEQYPVDKLVTQENQGVAMAMDAGVRVSRGACYLRLDADDILHPDYVMKTLSLLNRNPEAAFVYTSAFVFGAASALLRSREYSLRDLLRGNYITSAALVRSEAYRVVGPCDSDLSVLEDWDHWLAFAEHGFAGIFLPQPLLYWRRHTSASRNTKPWYALNEAGHTIRGKHKRLYQQHAALTDKIRYGVLNAIRGPARLLCDPTSNLAPGLRGLIGNRLISSERALTTLPAEATCPRFPFLATHCCRQAARRPETLQSS